MSTTITGRLDIGKGKESVNWVDGGTSVPAMTVIFNTVKVTDRDQAVKLLQDMIKNVQEGQWRPVAGGS